MPSSAGTIGKILVVAPSWVGDAVMTQPLFRRLRERHPGALLDILAPAWTLPIFRRMPEVHHALPNPFGHGELGLAARFQLGRGLARDGYDQAVILPNSLKSALVPFFARIPIRTGYVGEMRWGLVNDVRPLDKNALPLMVERFAALADPKGVPLVRPVAGPRLKVDEERRQAALRGLGLTTEPPVAAFCVGAEYGPAKQWPAEHFATLARLLQGRGHQVWLLGSAKDGEIGACIESLAPGACINLCGRTNLDQAVDLLASASLVVSNDSGLMHVAAALDKPMVALYGSSSPGFTPPLSTRAKVLSLQLPCSPCFERECPLGHFDCMTKLSPERVLAEAEALTAKP